MRKEWGKEKDEIPGNIPTIHLQIPVREHASYGFYCNIHHVFMLTFNVAPSCNLGLYGCFYTIEFLCFDTKNVLDAYTLCFWLTM